MKLTKSKIAFIAKHMDSFNVLTCITLQSEQPPRQNADYTMRQVVNNIEAIPYFRSLGGRESATINTRKNGQHNLVVIQMLSVSPEGSQYTEYTIYLTCDSATHHGMLAA